MGKSTALALLVSAALATYPGAAARAQAADHEIALEGQITAESVDRLTREIANAPSPPTTLTVNSSGGDAGAAMRLGRLVRGHGLRIRVERLCAAVCALYLLPAAPRVTFADGALIIFAQMPSPQMEAIMTAQAAQPGATPEQRNRIAQAQATLRRVLVSQDQFYREMGADPSRMYRTMDAWMELSRALHASGGAVQTAVLMPDRAFVQRCLGLANVDWRQLTADDSARLAHAGHTPLALMIEGDIYYEGRKISTQRFSC